MSRSILITGANGALGLAIAEYFLTKEEDCHVFLGVRERRDRAEELTTRFAGRATLITLEITSPEAWTTALAEIEGKAAPLGVLVNNAGFHEDALLANMSADQWSRVLDANLNAVFHGCQAVLPGMMRERHGRIINISSLSAISSPAGQTNYAAAKAGVIGLTQSLAKESARMGITVNAVCPGWVRTESSMRSLKTMSEHSGRAESDLLAEIIAGQVLDGLMTPADIVGPYLFLASPLAANITGQALNIDRGEVMI